MKRYVQKTYSILLCAAMLLAFLAPGAWASAAETQARSVQFEGAPTKAEAYIMDGDCAIKLRDMAALLRGTQAEFAVNYDTAKQTASITTGQAYEPLGTELAGPAKGGPVRYSKGYAIEIDGKRANISSCLIDGANFVSAAGLCGALGLSCEQTADGVSVSLAKAEAAAGYSMDITTYAAQWKYLTEAAKVDKGAAVTDEAGNPVYEAVHPCYMLNVVYCEKPVDPKLQSMTIYVPAEYMTKNADGTVTVNASGTMRSVDEAGAVTTYTAQTAPIIYENTIDAYNESTGFSLAQSNKGGKIGTFNDFLKSGYILVDIGSRGKNTTTADGSAPAAIVDLKAGIRFLKANDAAMAGDANKIVEMGVSAGGAMAALLAASGNSPLYDPYLREIGAVMDSSDDVYCALVYCPIADLDHADAEYEWLHSTETSYKQGWGPNAATADFSDSAYNMALQAALIESYEQYLASLGIDKDAFHAGFEAIATACVQDYAADHPDEARDFADKYDYIAAGKDGKLSVTSLEDLISGSAARGKPIPAFDSGNGTENQLFTVNGKPAHFSTNTYHVLQKLAEDWPEAASSLDSYQKDLTESQIKREQLMNPMAFLADGKTDIAPYWRFRNGTTDGDAGGIAAMLMNYVLSDMDGVTSEYELVWGVGHQAADYSYQDVQMYINSICGTPEKSETGKPDAEPELTLETLKKSFALTVDPAGLSAEELYAKGQQYEKGDGVVQWYAMAAAWYEAADAAGSTEAAEAIKRLNAHKESVLNNSPDGQGEIFEFFRTGVTAGQAGDYEKAYAVYFDDAFFFEDPVLRGIGSLGDLLRDGNGVEQDMERAIAIYQFNAKVLGKGGGYSSLGLLYQAEDGTYPGIKHSNDKALGYFVRSFKGEGLTGTDFKGPRYAGDFYDAGYTHDDGTFEKPDYVKAEECYIAASEGNGRTFDGTACYKLGVYYEEGREGIEQDYEKAAQFYLKAVSDPNTHATMLGIPQTYLALGRFYENGLGVEKDLEAAVSYYTKARDAAQENMELVNAAGNEAAKSVYADASAALERLKNA